jgi:hypothetical protein
MKNKEKSFHTHLTEDGILIKCYHKSKSAVFTAFMWFLGITASFPIEHFIWEKIWPFKEISQFLGL